MNKYIAIVDSKTLALSVLCVVVNYVCLRFDLAYDLNVTMFSIAVIFPLVFTIREAFKRRDAGLKFLSLYKASMGSVHYCFEQCQKLTVAQRREVNALLHRASEQFLGTMNSDGVDNRPAEQTIDQVVDFVHVHRKNISRGMALKIIRFTQDVNESMQNTLSLKIHGTPISMRAYCLVFVFIFPFVFVPTIAYHLPDAPTPLTYALSLLHGFILISLYNVQVQMENPFDRVGLDDIVMEEYGFRRQIDPREEAPVQLPAQPVRAAPPEVEHG